MGLMTQNGSQPSPLNTELDIAGSGGATVPVTTPDSVPNLEVPQTPVQKLEDLPFIQNPALQRMAFDQSQYPETLKAIQGYMEGHRLSVMYFQSINKQGNDIRTNIVDSPNERSVIHNAYRRINNFEITLKDPWTFDYDPETAQASITGIAYIYPGMNPRIGDVFLTSAGDNKMAIFKVSSVAPLSWRSQKAYQIGYYFSTYPSATDIQVLEGSVVQNVYFDKANYLGSVTSLLVEDKYQDLHSMRAFRDILARYYFKTFYSEVLGSFFRPDNGVYDPYLVKYMSSMCGFDIVKRRPRQLYATVDQTYDFTIWSRLCDRYNPCLGDLYPAYQVAFYYGHSMDVGLTTLANHNYLTVCNPANVDPLVDPVIPTPYVFSSAFYDSDLFGMTPFEQIVYGAVTTRNLTDTQTLINTYLKTYLSQPKLIQFYFIPVYLQLIDIAITSISRIVP